MTVDRADGVVSVMLTLADWAQLHAGLDAWAKHFRSEPMGAELAAKYQRIDDAVVQQVEAAITRGEVF